ncbi:autotransporter outer membrane beta-barrel domain-containing protein [Ponticaulis sp.]|uniref:autotransporter outer membrane beta-barrel domain-containing protein n=1 Tax=Ponticaulis sp. TaxID=2020902 RepID=UPI0026162F73|nr:autotransporter outer membrane beta-barrel domain-containing protein [Ponticaulis sp.]MDF1680344.1 autotransporter outer membrane beta-barrel domain-containing protein [Ponticaulis sp.]
MSSASLIAFPANADHFVICDDLNDNWENERCWHDEDRPDHKGGSVVVIGEDYPDFPDTPARYAISIRAGYSGDYFGVNIMPVDNLYLGVHGNIRHGAILQSEGVLQVTGAGAGLNVEETIYLGKDGGSGQLIINQGGVVYADTVLTGGYYDDKIARGWGNGQISLSDAGSLLRANEITLGVNDTSFQQLQISDQAMVQADRLTVNSLGYITNTPSEYKPVLEINGGTLEVSVLSFSMDPQHVVKNMIGVVGDGGTLNAAQIDAPFSGDAENGYYSALTFTGGTLHISDQNGGVRYFTRSTTINGMLLLASGSTVAFDATILDNSPDLHISHGIAAPAHSDNGAFNILINPATDGSKPELDIQFPIITVDDGSLNADRAQVNQSYRFIDGTLSTTSDTMYITFSRNDTPLTTDAVTSNELAVSSALEAAGPGHDVHDSILALTTQQSSRAAFNGLSGEIHATAMSATIDQGLNAGTTSIDRLQQVLDHNSSERAGANFWLTNHGSKATYDGEGSAETSDTDYFAIFAGVDAQTGSGLQIGGSVGYAQSFVRLESRNSQADIESFSAQIYSGKRTEAFQLLGGAGITSHQIDSRRITGLASLSGQLTADYSAVSANAWTDISRNYQLQNTRLQPFLRMDYIITESSDFTERTHDASLQSSEDTHSNLFSTAGIRLSHDLYITDEKATQITGAVGWRHTIGDVTPDQTMQYAAGSNSFQIEGRAFDRDLLAVDLGFSSHTPSGFELRIGYSGLFGETTTEHGLMATARLPF